MKRLTYNTLKEMKYDGYLLEEAPERILQFGEGGFMRAFVDCFVDEMNEHANFNSKTVVVQPVGSNRRMKEMINEQDGLYSLYLRGCRNGQKVSEKRIISCVSRCLNPYDDHEAILACADNPNLRFIISNTTEAGIVYDPSCRFEDQPVSSFPGKLTQFLYRRFQTFNGNKEKGLIVLPCELIDDNGRELEKCVLQYALQWKLADAFIEWIKNSCLFCSTLVDRIVTGFPRSEAAEINKTNGYVDNLIDTGELFGLWVIEGPPSLKEELPFVKAGLPIMITDDHKPYKQRKVRILNGAHTSFSLGAYLAGWDIVRDCMDDEIICKFMSKTIYSEIIPTLSLPLDELEDFAASVIDRFRNPFINHALLDISLNSTAKWKARVLPSLKDYIKRFHDLPTCLTASFAFYIAFYLGYRENSDGMIARRRENEYTVKDNAAVLDFFLSHKDLDTDSLVLNVCQNEEFWGEDLSKLSGFVSAVSKDLKVIKSKGTYELMKKCLMQKP